MKPRHLAMVALLFAVGCSGSGGNSGADNNPTKLKLEEGQTLVTYSVPDMT